MFRNNRDIHFEENNVMMDMDVNMSSVDNMNTSLPGIMCQPIYECPKETVCHRYICHEVPHIMPCKTRIINHHVYKHTYTPEYSCCEENVVSNVYEQNNCM